MNFDSLQVFVFAAQLAGPPKTLLLQCWWNFYQIMFGNFTVQSYGWILSWSSWGSVFVDGLAALGSASSTVGLGMGSCSPNISVTTASVKSQMGFPMWVLHLVQCVCVCAVQMTHCNLYMNTFFIHFTDEKKQIVNHMLIGSVYTMHVFLVVCCSFRFNFFSAPPRSHILHLCRIDS
jgi:hypothetical protein